MILGVASATCKNFAGFFLLNGGISADIGTMKKGAFQLGLWRVQKRSSQLMLIMRRTPDCAAKTSGQ